MKSPSRFWSWCGTIASGLCILMWLTAIGARPSEFPLPFDPTRLTGSNEANAIITLAAVAILIHLGAYAWRIDQELKGRPLPAFAFRGVTNKDLDERRMRGLWRILSVIVCIILPVLGSLWMMQFIAVGSIYDMSTLSPNPAYRYMATAAWGGGNSLRIGNAHGGEFFPLLTDILFLAALLAYGHLALAMSGAFKRTPGAQRI